MAHNETYELKYPFTHKGEEFTELCIRRPKLRDLKKADKIKDELTKSISMLADLAEIETGAMDEMDPEDFNNASKIVARFLGVSEEDIQRRFAR